MINCPNPSCKTANPEDAEVCQVCQSALPHYYLWGVGDLVPALKANSLVNQRYLLKRDGVFLDTKPGLVPESPPEMPAFLTAYLRLSAYPLHVPRVYASMKTPDGDYLTLLESSALAESAESAASHSVPERLPALGVAWKMAPPLRQLNWLWQIAQLWEPFSQEQVAATLLDRDLLRVDGSIVRCLALAAGASADELPKSPTLIELGIYWRSLAETAHQAVRAFLERLCEQLERQQLSAEQLCERLSAAIAICGQGQVVDYDLAVYTDQGPTRKRNEDACYPKSGTVQSTSAAQTRTTPQLLIVCDGIGGHQGGDVASKLAIETIRNQLAPLLREDAPEQSSTVLSLAIEEAICAANDEISIQNDQAQRQARDRMGTTLVLALVKGADVYIAHLGDSRAYRISLRNCQQVTLDDDVASRQVRLAGGLYREALTQPGAGSLIQALGMGPSQTLRPTVQRFAIDEDCLFLLCSDGLSDSDRVEQFWQSVLKPLVANSKASVAAVGQRLVHLANKYNGHDNVTVGLLDVRVGLPSDRMVPRDVAATPVADDTAATPVTKLPSRKRPQTGLVPLEETASNTDGSTKLQSVASAERGKPVASQAQRSSPGGANGARGLKKIAIALAMLAGIGGLLYYLFPGGDYRFGSSVTSASGGLETLNGDAESPTVRTVNVPVQLQRDAYVQILPAEVVRARLSADLPAAESNGTATPGISDSEPVEEERATLILIYPDPLEDIAAVREDPRTMPENTFARIVDLREVGGQQWVQLLVCSSASNNALESADASTSPVPVGEVPLLLAGNEGWALSSSVEKFAQGVLELQADQRGSCGS